MSTATTILRQRQPAPASELAIGFAAGFLATLLFHQPVLALLTQIGLAKASVYSFAATAPLGVPQVISVAFWGGIWGIVLAAVHRRFPAGPRYWIYALVFGALFPTLVAWFVVAPLKGLPVAGGWEANRMITGLVVNGAWGIGTALLLVLALRLQARAH